MAISKTRLYKKPVMAGLGVVLGALAVAFPQAVHSQTQSIPVIRILRVTASGGTTFKLQENWYIQSGQIQDNSKKCGVRTGDKFFVATINDNRNSQTEFKDGNRVEKLRDYYTVTFDKTLACNQQGQTWYIFKSHVQQLQAVPVR
ncbi:hypothetical protein CLI64_00850 [Nostoc sp. CENA543]|uniref:hypothetical protein n=1 Tax=Nostoc sp. CENA543 TaxID=1869241 RepID=UPI000CA34034|nr:hypothetical protein [Nostoc sp. CENA543]AUS99063.1 hypothetical protein CLI64_00850 [Nostoc sp. CENA543]